MKRRVGVLGATGMVGQRFLSLLDNHPWFDVKIVAASARSAGKTYEEAVGGRWKLKTPMPEYVKNMVVKDANDVDSIASEVDFVFCAVDMKKEEIKELEERYAKAECPVVSNNSAHRFTPDVPMIVPEINPEHAAIIPGRENVWEPKRIYKCEVKLLSPKLYSSPSSIRDFGLDKVLVTTYQAISGAGKDFDSC